MATQPLLFDALILGAGAAGLYAATLLAQKGVSVALVDKGIPGKKLSLAGGGMGNFTNFSMGPEFYVGEQPEFCAPVLRRFPPQNVLALLEECGIPWEERAYGQVFGLKPARVFVEYMLAKAKENGARVFAGTPVEDVACTQGAKQGPFTMRVGGQTLAAQRLCLATGSPAWPASGADDTGMRLAGQWGHSLVPVRPVLCPLVLPEGSVFLGLEGINLPVSIHIEGVNNPCLPVVRSLLFTHKGISGPAALVASCFWRKGQALVVDFLPEDHAAKKAGGKASASFLEETMHKPENGKLLVKNLFKRLMPERVAAALLTPFPLIAEKKVAELGKKDRLALAEAVHACTLYPNRTEGMVRAEAAAGGIATKDVDPATMQSTKTKGLYFCGEMLDITGILGGYNLHFAFASAYTLARAF